MRSRPSPALRFATSADASTARRTSSSGACDPRDPPPVLASGSGHHLLAQPHQALGDVPRAASVRWTPAACRPPAARRRPTAPSAPRAGAPRSVSSRAIRAVVLGVAGLAAGCLGVVVRAGELVDARLEVAQASPTPTPTAPAAPTAGRAADRRRSRPPARPARHSASRAGRAVRAAGGGARDRRTR